MSIQQDRPQEQIVFNQEVIVSETEIMQTRAGVVMSSQLQKYDRWDPTFQMCVKENEGAIAIMEEENADRVDDLIEVLQAMPFDVKRALDPLKRGQSELRSSHADSLIKDYPFIAAVLMGKHANVVIREHGEQIESIQAEQQKIKDLGKGLWPPKD